MNIEFTRKSPITNITRTMFFSVDPDLHATYDNDRTSMNIQDAYPTLDADQREFILTGITSTEWDFMWKEHDDGEANAES